MKTAIIIGAAGGIGQILAKEFCRAGFGVTLVGRKQVNLEELNKTLPPTARAQTISVDVTQLEAVEKIFAEHEEFFKQPADVVINLAAQQGPLGAVWEVDAEGWFDSVRHNLMPAFLLTSTAIHWARKYNKMCSIIHFSGGGAAYARPYFSAYGCSKTALLRFVETVAVELQEQGFGQMIQINAIAPGAINTAMTQEILNAGRAIVGEKAFAEAAKVQEGNGQSPKNAADLCLFLSDRAKNQGISGKLIHVNDPYLQWQARTAQINLSEQGLLRRINYDK